MTPPTRYRPWNWEPLDADAVRHLDLDPHRPWEGFFLNAPWTDAQGNRPCLLICARVRKRIAA